MKCILFFLFAGSLTQAPALAQEAGPESRHLRFYLGVQTRITPIYPEGVPGGVRVSDRNIWEQPDKHLSGPSVVYTFEKLLEDDWSVSFSHAIRYDFLYQTLPFNTQPLQGFRPDVKRAVMNDLYIDAYKAIALNKSALKLGAGLALCGLGSGYLLTQRFVDNSNQSIYITSKEDFIFPAITAHFGWQKNRFGTSLQAGYAWHNPTLFGIPFLFPELKVQYRLFSL